MPTGVGNHFVISCLFVVKGTAVVISPLIALMKNQVDAMRNFSEEDGVASFH
jgi:ATP-dependent DNA helicase RecQ